jgi:hypothetical protein
MRKETVWWTIPCTMLTILGLTASQSMRSTRSVSINGNIGQATVYQIDGKNLIGIEDLAQIARGSVSYEGDQINLSLPASERVDPGSSSTAGTTKKLSPEFMGASLHALGVIEDWSSKLAFAAQKGTPGDGSQVVVLRDRAAAAMRPATATAASEADRDALQLLTNYFNTVSAWSDKLVEERKRMDTAKYSISEGAIEKDETYQKITACNKFLSSMLSAGALQEGHVCY